MKVTFIKRHLEYKPGDEAELDEGIAGYLIKVKVATIETPTDEELEEKLNKKLKAKKKK